MKIIFFLLLIIFPGLLFSEVSEDSIITSDFFGGNKVAGEARYNVNCKNCHGPAGQGAASYPKISGNEISYTIDKLIRYRNGEEIGPNSALMIMMAKSLSDKDIANLAAYLKEAKYKP